MAEIIGSHLALSSPAATAWRRVAHGELTPEEAVVQLDTPEEQALARQVFAAPTPERREALLQVLVAMLDAGPRRSRS